MAECGEQQREVTYEAVDRGASCLLGCLTLSCLLVGVGMGLWFATGGMAIWKAVVSVLALAAGISLVVFLRSPMRGRWEVTFDPQARVVRLYSRLHGSVSVEEISYDEIERIGLVQIRRERSDAERARLKRRLHLGTSKEYESADWESPTAAFQVPVLYLKGGREPVRLDEKLSTRDPERAQEVVAEMNELLGIGRAIGTPDQGTCDR